ncbi:MAG: twitching motility protein PilT [Lachnospiraceae bacterium]|nr:twitching motility protein PilT [Lachnospiraceae bacterium]
MVQLIIGEKGKGKTKVLLDKVNEEVLNANGNYVYLDKSSKHMYELNNKVRLIDVSNFYIENPDQFVGFISGIISQDHDLEKMYFDNFLSISNCGDDFEDLLAKIEKISNNYKVDFVISMSKVEKDFSDAWKNCIIVSL